MHFLWLLLITVCIALGASLGVFTFLMAAELPILAAYIISFIISTVIIIGGCGFAGEMDE